jgi:nucleoside 2-deoxyribosyltransferase
VEYTVGFTGTQRGGTEEQEAAFFNYVVSRRLDVFCHGDCVGWDAHAHDVIRALHPLCRIESFPPLNPEKRAFKEADITHRREEYLTRNKKIVDKCHVLIAAPGEMHEVIRSGTWSTVRYARKLGKPVVLIYPDGSTETTGFNETE